MAPSDRPVGNGRPYAGLARARRRIANVSVNTGWRRLSWLLLAALLALAALGPVGTVGASTSVTPVPAGNGGIHPGHRVEARQTSPSGPMDLAIAKALFTGSPSLNFDTFDNGISVINYTDDFGTAGDFSSGYAGSVSYRLTLAKTGDPIIVSSGDEGGTLTNDIMHTGFIDLGALKGNRGSQNYAIPAGTDLAAFKSAVIWCRRFAVGFGVAPLSP